MFKKIKLYIKKLKDYVKKSKILTHETKRVSLKRFLLLVAVIISYFIFVSIKFGLNQGFMVTILTWSFFVFCTPIADAGFLLDFPVRLITRIRMIHSEMMVWSIASLLNIFSLIFNRKIYERTILLKLLKHVLLHPFPFWAIIALSAIGTYLSIYFGDELMDVSKNKYRKKYMKHKNKYKLVLIIFIVVVIIILYDFLLKKLGIKF